MTDTLQSTIQRLGSNLLWPLRLLNSDRDEVRQHLDQAYQDTLLELEKDPDNRQLRRQANSLAAAISNYQRYQN